MTDEEQSVHTILNGENREAYADLVRLHLSMW